MQSPMKLHCGKHQTACVASKIRMFERLHRLQQQSCCQRQRPVLVSATGSKSTTVHFKTHYQCAFGEELKLVGNRQELGNWDVSSAPTLNWTDGDDWSGQFKLDNVEDTKFKLVLLSPRGVVWEPVSDRVLQSTSQSGLPDVELDLLWGREGYQIAADTEDCASDATPSNAAEEFNSLWDPLHSGSTPPAASPAPAGRQALERRSACGVTLEPEWGVLDLDEPQPDVAEPVSSVSAETATPEPTAGPKLESTPVLSEVPTTETQLASETSTPSVPSPSPRVASTAAASQEKGLVKRRKKSRSSRSARQQNIGLQTSMPASQLQNIQHMAVGGLAAAVLSATGAHFQDIVLGSVSIAAGVAALPMVLRPKERVLDFDAQAAVLPVIQGIGEAVLKTVFVFNTMRQAISKRLEYVASRKVAATQSASDSDEELSEEEFEVQLAEYVSGLVEEATAYAQSLCSSQDDLEVLTSLQSATELAGARKDDYIGNIIIANAKGAGSLSVTS